MQYRWAGTGPIRTGERAGQTGDGCIPIRALSTLKSQLHNLEYPTSLRRAVFGMIDISAWPRFDPPHGCPFLSNCPACSEDDFDVNTFHLSIR